MLFLDVLYVGFATVTVMALLQVLMYVTFKVLAPPQIIHVPVPAPAPPAPPPSVHIPFPIGPPPGAPPALTQQPQEVQVPEYEPRLQSATTSSRMDTGLPDGLQETRPDGL
jgi:hypothetical protein